MKKFYLFAAMAAMLASCSSDDLTAEKQAAAPEAAGDGAIEFSAYVNRGTTRAGTPGELTTSTASTPQISLQNEGFGVFGYYGDGNLYGSTSKPDFFYNQKVSGAGWDYSPKKYWPNEFGTTAESDGQDRLTFFAYAPWVDVTPSTGRIKSGSTTSGIIALTSNNTTGDPYVKYCVDFDPENRVDLCYGVCADGFNSSVDDTQSPNAIAAGSNFVDVVKPKTSDKIKFNFKHALAALNVQIDADINQESHGDNAYLDGFTKIYVREVTFEGFTNKGMLNLYSSAQPQWFEMTTANTLISGGKVTIYDGRSNGKEGQSNGAATNETPNDLNEKIIQKSDPTDGVPATLPVNLFNSTIADAPIYVIPTGQQLKVTIVYDVETADENLPGFLSDGETHGSTVENKITKNITYNTGSALIMEAGKLYNVSLHLGMTSVKFDADVTVWPGAITADNTDLPINQSGEYAAGGSHTISVPAAAVTDATFTINGLTDAEAAAASITGDGSIISSASASTPVASNATTVTYSTKVNNTFLNRTDQVTVTTASKTTIINFVQSAQALGLSVNNIDAAGTVITLNSTGTFSDAADWANVGKTKWTVIKKTAAGVTSTVTPTIAGVSTTSATVTLSEAVAAGEEYYITVQTGDAAAETVTVKIGGVAFASATQDVTKAANETFQALEPIIYGNGIIAASAWSSATTATAEINANTGLLTAKATGSSDITVHLTEPGASDGYFYTTASKAANYTLNLTVAP